MNTTTGASALFKTLKTFSASLLMFGMIAMSFPITALAQETVELEVVTETTETTDTTTDTPPAPQECDAGFHLEGEECVADEPAPQGEVQGLQTESLETETATKLPICHNGHVISPDDNGWNGHQHHDDDFLIEDEADLAACAAEAEENEGSITVCKIIVDENDVVVTGSGLDATFTIPWLEVTTSEGQYEAALTDAEFSTGLTFNKKILSSSQGNDAECTTYDGLSAGHYYYGQEAVSGDDADRFEIVGYSDYSGEIPDVADELSDVGAYSGELFDGNAGNDGSRNQERDGDVNLGDGADRTLVVVNRLFDEEVTPSVTVSATKIVCDAEQYLPNMSGGSDILPSTAADFLAQNSEHCWLEDGYQFQWAPNGTADPDDNGAAPLGSPWTSFGPTDENGVATVSIPLASANGVIQVREVLQEGDLAFAGTAGNDISAELYCHNDVAGSDNWEWIQGLSEGATYDCVAWNVHPRETEDSCVVYSSTETLEGADAAVEVPSINSRWTASMDALAKWIWGETPMIFTAGQEVETFTRVFALAEASSGGTLEIAADNGYSVKLDNVALCSDMSDGPEGSHNYQLTDTCAVGALAAGNHTLEFTVTNYELAGENFSNNPAGLRYFLTMDGSQCSVPEIPDEPQNTCLVPQNAEAPEVDLGSTPEAEDTLQEILTAEYAAEAPDADDDQDNFQSWTGTGQDVTFTVKNISEDDNSGHSHVFGYYLNGSSTFVPVFREAGAGAPYAATDVVAYGATKQFTVEDVTSIEFAIYDWNNSTYYSTTNADNFLSEAHAVSYNVADDEYAIAFEDLVFGEGDEDYNDVVVSLHVDSCENGFACDPEEELLANGGFEAPAVVGDWNIVPSGTSGLEWLIAWINPSGAPDTANAEFQAGVNGWAPHSGDQYAELDSDWGGPSSGQTGEAGAVVMSQDVDTEPGQDYTFSFWFSARPDTGSGENKVEVLVDGNVVYATPTAAGNGSQTDWEEYSVTFEAEGETTTVAIRDAAGNPNNSVGSFVDDASLVCEPEEDDTATLLATKIVCPTEASLPNWGAGNVVGEITSTTDEEFLLAHPECHVENWDFQWATDAAGDPEDNGTVALLAPWTTFSSGSPIEIPEGINLRVREVLQTGFIPFTGENTDQPVSAEMYCGTDVLHYDNWEHINGTNADDTYYCVAFNAPVDDGGPGEDEGTLIINKYTGEDGDDTFTFQIDKEYDVYTLLSPEVSSAVEVTTTGGEGSEDVNLEEGWYDITELVPEGWDLTDVTCEYEYSEGSQISNGYSIYIDEGETVTCNFYNEAEDGEPGEDTSEVIVVTDSNPNGWSLLNYDVSNDFDGPVTTTSGTDGYFVFGPETAPLGDGSFEQVVVNGDDATRLVTSDYNGTPLADITGMAYETYVTANGGAQATYVQIRIDRDGNGAWDDALFFEPVYQNGTYGMLYGQPAVPNQCGGNPNCVSLGEWQSWDLDQGGWWSNVDSAGGPPLTTLAAYAAQYPGAKLATDVPAIRLQAGFGAPVWDDFQGNFDEFVIAVTDGFTHTTTYDFEPEDTSVTPDPEDNGTNNRSGSHRRSGGGGGEVLGATTCAPLLTQYLHIGWNNDAGEVMKLQEFLNAHLGLTPPLAVTGFFGNDTFEAVKAFQTKYWQDVLKPWFGRPDSGIQNEGTPTGYVYQTTRWQINNIWCPGSEAFPDTLI